MLAAGVGACQVQFVSSYDDVFDREVSATQMDVDALMNRIASDPGAPYVSFSADYAKIGTDFDALTVRAGVLTHNVDTQNSVASLRHTFTEFQAEHANPATPVNAAHVRGELGILNHEFQILMAQEMAKKSGSK